MSKLYEEAQELPWALKPVGNGYFHIANSKGLHVHKSDDSYLSVIMQRDAKLIVHSVNNLPLVLAALEEILEHYVDYVRHDWNPEEEPKVIAARAAIAAAKGLAQDEPKADPSDAQFKKAVKAFWRSPSTNGPDEEPAPGKEAEWFGSREEFEVALRAAIAAAKDPTP